MVDSNETIMYESGRDQGYSVGYLEALETVEERLNECVRAIEYPNGEEYKYIPYECFREVMNDLLDY